MAESTGIPERSTDDVIPIIDLKPSLNKYTVMGRVYYKSPIKLSESGLVTYMVFYLLDQTAEIRAYAPGNATDLRGLYDELEIDEVYYISGNNDQNAVQKVSEKYNKLDHPYELNIDDYKSIEKAKDSGNIPNMPEIKFQPIKEIRTLPIDTFVNLIGVCYDASDLRTILKDGIEVDIRNLELMDVDGESITLTLWREDAEDEEKFNWQGNPVIVARNVKVYEFKNDILLNFVGASMLFVNPNIPETYSTAQAVRQLRRFAHMA